MNETEERMGWPCELIRMCHFGFNFYLWFLLKGLSRAKVLCCRIYMVGEKDGYKHLGRVECTYTIYWWRNVYEVDFYKV